MSKCQNGLGYISDTYPNPYPPLTAPPLLMIIRERLRRDNAVPARWGNPARGIPTAKPPTIRESHKPGPPLEPGPLAPCPFPKRCRKGVRVPAGSGPGSKGVRDPARGILRPIRGKERGNATSRVPPNEKVQFPGPISPLFSLKFGA